MSTFSWTHVRGQFLGYYTGIKRTVFAACFRHAWLTTCRGGCGQKSRPICTSWPMTGTYQMASPQARPRQGPKAPRLRHWPAADAVVKGEDVARWQNVPLGRQTVHTDFLHTWLHQVRAFMQARATDVSVDVRQEGVRLYQGINVNISIFGINRTTYHELLLHIPVTLELHILCLSVGIFLLEYCLFSVTVGLRFVATSVCWSGI